MLQVTVDAAAADELLGDLADGLNEPGPLLRFMAEKMADYEREVFATGGLGQWAPLDPDTVAAKGSGRVLVDDGDLLDALTRATAGSVRVDGDNVTLRTDEVSAEMLQRGARGMPKRNPAPAPPESVVAVWGEDLLGALTERRLR